MVSFFMESCYLKKDTILAQFLDFVNYFLISFFFKERKEETGKKSLKAWIYYALPSQLESIIGLVQIMKLFIEILFCLKEKML